MLGLLVNVIVIVLDVLIEYLDVIDADGVCEFTLDIV